MRFLYALLSFFLINRIYFLNCSTVSSGNNNDLFFETSSEYDNGAFLRRNPSIYFSNGDNAILEDYESFDKADGLEDSVSQDYLEKENEHSFDLVLNSFNKLESEGTNSKNKEDGIVLWNKIIKKTKILSTEKSVSMKLNKNIEETLVDAEDFSGRGSGSGSGSGHNDYFEDHNNFPQLSEQYGKNTKNIIDKNSDFINKDKGTTLWNVLGKEATNRVLRTDSNTFLDDEDFYNSGSGSGSTIYPNDFHKDDISNFPQFTKQYEINTENIIDKNKVSDFISKDKSTTLWNELEKEVTNKVLRTDCSTFLDDEDFYNSGSGSGSTIYPHDFNKDGISIFPQFTKQYETNTENIIDKNEDSDFISKDKSATLWNELDKEATNKGHRTDSITFLDDEDFYNSGSGSGSTIYPNDFHYDDISNFPKLTKRYESNRENNIDKNEYSDFISKDKSTTLWNELDKEATNKGHRTDSITFLDDEDFYNSGSGSGSTI